MFSPIEVHFSPSRLGCWWYRLLATLAISAILLTDLLLFTRVVLSCVLASWCYFFPFDTDPYTAGFERLRWQPREGRVQLYSAGEWLEVERVSAIFCTRYVLLFRLSIPRRYCVSPLMVWYDSLSVTDYRRLAVGLRFAKPPQVVQLSAETEAASKTH